MQERPFDIGDDYGLVFNADFKNIIIAAIQKAYLHATESHIPEYGGDEFTFGVTVWRYITKEVREILKNDLSTTVIEKNNRLRVRKSGYKIGFAKVGATGKEDIEVSFPHNMHNASELAFAQEAQLYLFQNSGEEIEVTHLRNIMISHMGNPYDGLCAIYICFPMYKSLGTEEEIISWAYTENIWHINDSKIENAYLGIDATSKVPIEKVAAPVLKLKEDSQQGSE